MLGTLRAAFLATAATLTFAGAAQAATIADVMASDPRFTTLLTLVQRAGLTDSFRQPTRVTIFAPTNAAFERVPTEQLRSLAPQGGNLNPTQFVPELQSLVRIHYLQNEYLPASFTGQRVQVTSTAGTPLIIDGTQGGGIAVTTIPQNAGGPNIAGVTTARTAQVIGLPIETDNGIIYPVDNVLLQ